MSLLLSQPTDVFISLASEWLYLSDICLFDSSLCNHESRSHYLIAIRSQFIIAQDNQRLSSSRNCIVWLLSRHIKTKTLTLNNGCVTNLSDVEMSCVWAILMPTVRELVIMPQLSLCNAGKVFGKLGCGLDIYKQKLHLRIFTCTDTAYFDDSVLMNLTALMPELRSCDLSKCVNVSCKGLVFLDKCKRLECLTVSGCPDLRSVGVYHVLSRCTKLTELDTSDCRHIHQISFENSGVSCSKLNAIKVTSCFLITNETINNFISRNCSITTLHIGCCSNLSLTDSFMKGVSIRCPNLTDLNISNALHVTNSTLDSLPMYCPHMKHLNISHIEHITEIGVRRMCTAFMELVQITFMQNRSSRSCLFFHSVLSLFHVITEIDIVKCSVEGKRHSCEQVLTLCAMHAASIAEYFLRRKNSCGVVHHILFNMTNTGQLDTLNAMSVHTHLSVGILSSLLPKQSMLRKIVASDPQFLVVEGVAEGVAFSEESRLTDLKLYVICRNSPMLEEINIDGCLLVTDAGLCDIGKFCKHLTTLKCNMDFAHFESSIGDFGVMCVAASCDELTYLDVSYCTQVTDRSLEALARHQCRNSLTTILIRGCTEISARGITCVMARCVRINILNNNNV